MTIADEYVEDFLSHHGVKGMKWGVRKADAGSSGRESIPGVSRKTNKTASQDAQEYARAKMFHGKGAGTRRKLIQAKVDSRSKQSESYRKAFEHHLAKQDMGKHAEKAVSERKSIDRRTRTKQRLGAIARRLTGEWGTQAAVIALVAMGVAYARSQHGQETLRKGMSAVHSLDGKRKQAKGARAIQDILNKSI